MACCLGFSTGAAQQTVHTTLGITWPLDFRTNAYRQSAIGFFAKVDRNFTENVQLGVKVQTEGHTARVSEMAGYIYGAELLKSLDLSPTDVVEIYVPARSFVAALTGAYVWNRNERWAPRLGRPSASRTTRPAAAFSQLRAHGTAPSNRKWVSPTANTGM